MADALPVDEVLDFSPVKFRVNNFFDFALGGSISILLIETISGGAGRPRALRKGCSSST